MSEPPIIELRAELAREIISGFVRVGQTEITMLEDEISRRGLEVEYTTALKSIVAKAAPLDHDKHFMFALWRFVRAAPEQRARAFLEATGANL